MKIKLVLASVVLASVLTGCASVGDDNMPQVQPLKPVSGKYVFSSSLVSDPDIVKALDQNDQSKLVQLIGSAGPQQTVSWKSLTSSKTFEFTSLKVFVNDQGQACRNYKLRVTSTWHNKELSPVTACRMDNGDWKGI